MPVSMRECSTSPPSDVDAQVVSIFTDKSAVTFSIDDQKEEPFSASGLSFKFYDEFFHGMLSYRVRTEGPSDAGGNNLARLIHDACCKVSESQKGDAQLDKIQHFSEALQTFGKWPKVFAGQSQIRLFLDQANLRNGVPWKGTGDPDSGGFLGAVSRALFFVPLLSATPALFKLVVIDGTGSSKRYALESPINMKLTNDTELLSIQTDKGNGAQTVRGHLCKDIQSDERMNQSFQLSDMPQDIADLHFCCTENFLPSNGSGARGSLADLITIQQKPEDLTFTFISDSDGQIELEVVECSDHVFFPNETISLRIGTQTLYSSGSKTSSNDFTILQVICQGSKVSSLRSRIKIDVGIQSEVFAPDLSPILGTTKEIDRCDNVLMELMVCRALQTLTSGKLHPCKFIMPVFVDDFDMICRLSHRLSNNYSEKTSIEVQGALEAILQRKLTHAELSKWVRTSVKDVVQFFFAFQGLQLSNKTNRCKSMKEKASLVHMNFVTTAGIEAENNALSLYVSNNPLAHELREFLDDCGLLYLHSILVKHDITSVKEFSKLSKNDIKDIACEGQQLSTRPLMKEKVDIVCAVSAAQSSKYILPVSKRLELFEDKEASFLTVIYSSAAMYLALQKPIFSLGLQFIYFCLPFGTALYQTFANSASTTRYLPFIIPNYVRACWMLFSILLVHIFNSVNGAIRAWVFWTFMIGASTVGGFFLDKFEDGNFNWEYSKDCAASFSPQEYPAKYSACVYYYYAFFGYNTALAWVFTYCTLFRQDLVWRSVTIGISVQIIMAASKFVDPSTESITPAGILGFVFVLGCLAWTEMLRFYGSLQALQITYDDNQMNSERWIEVLKGSSKDLEILAQTLIKEFDHSILDRSSDLGKYISGSGVTKKPAMIQQPINNFDELYKIASIVNITFQTWIETFFSSDADPITFLFVEGLDNIDHIREHLRFKPCPHRAAQPFIGAVQRGPVKVPDRAIAKVSHHFSINIMFFVMNMSGLSLIPW
jgi:hypothetical protein